MKFSILTVACAALAMVCSPAIAYEKKDTEKDTAPDLMLTPPEQTPMSAAERFMWIQQNYDDGSSSGGTGGGNGGVKPCNYGYGYGFSRRPGGGVFTYCGKM